MGGSDRSRSPIRSHTAAALQLLGSAAVVASGVGLAVAAYRVWYYNNTEIRPGYYRGLLWRDAVPGVLYEFGTALLLLPVGFAALSRGRRRPSVRAFRVFVTTILVLVLLVVVANVAWQPRLTISS